MKHFLEVLRETKCKLYKTIILPAVLYGSESWTPSKDHEALLRGSERKILRRIYGAVQTGGVWRRHYNKEVYSLFNDVNIMKIIKINGLRLAGHVIRREYEEIIKIIMRIKLEWKRKKGRPRMRWLDGVEKDLRNMGVINCKTAS
jgi:hypothetical protein